MADHVYTDRASDQKIIAGVRRKIRFYKESIDNEEVAPKPETPEKSIVQGGVTLGGPSLFIYISLTEIYGQQDFLLRYVNLDTDLARFEKSISVVSKDPLEVIEAVYPLPQLPIGADGVFAVELVWEDETLGAFRILFEEVEKPNSNGGPS